MEFFIRTSDMQRVIKLLGVTAKMNDTSFEGQVLIKTNKDVAIFISRNSSSGLTCTVPAKIIVEGQSNILYSRMKSFIMTFAPWDGEIGAKEFHFVLRNTKLFVEVETFYENENSSKSKLHLEQFKVSSFFTPVEMDKSNLIINSNIIKTAIDKAIYAIDPNSSEKFTKGIRMLLKDKKIIYTATNGIVVSNYEVVNKSSKNDGEYFLPYGFIMGLRRLLADDTQLFFNITKQKIKASFDNVLYWSNSLSYDHWPPTDSVWNKYDKTIELRRDILLSGISAAADVLDKDDFNRVTIEMVNNKLYLRTDNSLFEYPNVEHTYSNFSVDISGRDLINSLNAISDNDIKFKCLDENNGVIIESCGKDDQKAFITNLILKKR